MKIGECTWDDHGFGIYAPDSNWGTFAGVYIFARENEQSPGRWFALYVGQTTSFAARLKDHERWPEAKRRGATHIHARVVQQAQQRTDLENRLIEMYGPPLNNLGAHRAGR